MKKENKKPYFNRIDKFRHHKIFINMDLGLFLTKFHLSVSKEDKVTIKGLDFKNGYKIHFLENSNYNFCEFFKNIKKTKDKFSAYIYKDFNKELLLVKYEDEYYNLKGILDSKKLLDNDFKVFKVEEKEETNLVFSKQKGDSFICLRPENIDEEKLFFLKKENKLKKILKCFRYYQNKKTRQN